MSLARAVLERVVGAAGRARAETRIERMDTHALVDWLDVGIAGTGKAFADWRSGQSTPDMDSLNEACVGAATVLLALDELARRRDAGLL